MRLLATFIILLPFLIGCQEKQDESKQQVLTQAQITEQVRTELRSEFAAKENALKKSLKQREEKIAQTARENLLAKQVVEVKKMKEKELLLEEKAKQMSAAKISKLGVGLDNGVITIDTNKTKNFLELLSSSLGDKLNKIKHDLEKDIIDTEKTGFEMSETHINIDLNKTKDLLDDWSSKINVFIEEFDTLAKDIKINLPKGN